MEGLLTPSGQFLTLDPSGDVENWALIRSRDNLTSHGFIQYESKFMMAELSGQCLDVINEIEQKNNATVQCPHQIRQGTDPHLQESYI